MTNLALNLAKKHKNDEFPTPKSIMEEISNLTQWEEKEIFKGKSLFLPCDDYRWSGFAKWFLLNYKEYGIGKIVCRSYEKGGHGRLYIRENGKEWISDTRGEGSYTEPEACRFRDEADIITTNPPFSVLENFTDWLLCSGKEIIILAPFALTNKWCKLLTSNVWSSNRLHGWKLPTTLRTNISGLIPQPVLSPTKTLAELQKEIPKDTPAGRKFFKRFIQFGKWAEEYPRDVVYVPKMAWIPSDYDGWMGVPITVMAYDLKNYDVVPHLLHGRLENEERDEFLRIVIKKRTSPLTPDFKTDKLNTLF